MTKFDEISRCVLIYNKLVKVRVQKSYQLKLAGNIPKTEPAVARQGRVDKIRELLDEIRRYFDKIIVKVSFQLVTACRLTSVTQF